MFNKLAQTLTRDVAEQLKVNARLFKRASKCCGCEKCDEKCKCDCDKDCGACDESMKMSAAVREITGLLVAASEIFDANGLESTATLAIQAAEYLIAEVAVKKFAQSMDVSDRLYKELLELGVAHPDLKRDVKGLLSEVDERGFDPSELEEPTRLPTKSLVAPKAFPRPSKVSDFDPELNGLEVDEEALRLNPERDAQFTLPPDKDKRAIEDDKLADEFDADDEESDELEPKHESGYTPCKCRDCFETAFDGGYCDECEAAGCPDYQGHKGMSQECQAAGAYGDSDGDFDGDRDSDGDFDGDRDDELRDDELHDDELHDEELHDDERFNNDFKSALQILKQIKTAKDKKEEEAEKEDVDWEDED